MIGEADTVILHFAFCILHSKKIPQGLWNVDGISVDSFAAGISSTEPVEKMYSLHHRGVDKNALGL